MEERGWWMTVTMVRPSPAKVLSADTTDCAWKLSKPLVGSVCVFCAVYVRFLSTKRWRK